MRRTARLCPQRQRGASLLAKSSPDVRLPLVNLTPAGQARVRDAMVHCGLIN